MTSDMSSFFAIVVLGTPVLLLLMLLPTLLELRKPRDAGPRLIMPNLSEVFPTLGMKVHLLPDIEEKYEMEVLLIPLVRNVLSVLSNLDA